MLKDDISDRDAVWLVEGGEVEVEFAYCVNDDILDEVFDFGADSVVVVEDVATGPRTAPAPVGETVVVNVEVLVSVIARVLVIWLVHCG